jgi:GNAT superfamily N-acetyltransferase
MPAVDQTDTDRIERLARASIGVERVRRAAVPDTSELTIDGLVGLFANVDVPWLNGVGVWEAPSDPTAALTAMDDAMRERHLPIGLMAIDGRHPALERAMLELGLEKAFSRPILTIDPGALSGPETVEGIEIERVRDEPSTAAFAAADVLAFEDPPEVAERFYAQTAFSPGVAAFVARSGGEAVGLAVGILFEGSVGVLGVGVVPAARRRGIGTALTLHAAHAFPDADLVWLEASEDGEPLYRQLGFRHQAMRSLWGRG